MNLFKLIQLSTEPEGIHLSREELAAVISNWGKDNQDIEDFINNVETYLEETHHDGYAGFEAWLEEQ